MGLQSSTPPGTGRAAPVSTALAGRSVAGRSAATNAIRRYPSAPKALTGCVSTISTCAPASHGYTHALRDYAAVYQAYQAYLQPEVSALAGRDGCAALDSGQLTGDSVVDDEAAQTETFSEEEIESCGYLGWLRH
jgi:hypothetical protein